MTNIDDLDLNGTYTYADYMKWAFDERFEIIKGKPYFLPSPGTVHQMCLGSLMHQFFQNEKKVKFYHAPFDVRLSVGDSQADEFIYNVVQPDISFYINDSSLDDFGAVKAPDLAIEIISPLIESNAKKEFGIKLKLYEEFRVKEYWIVEPILKLVFVYILNNEGKYIGLQPFTDEDILTSIIFPELLVNLQEVFQGYDHFR